MKIELTKIGVPTGIAGLIGLGAANQWIGVGMIVVAVFTIVAQQYGAFLSHRRFRELLSFARTNPELGTAALNKWFEIEAQSVRRATPTPIRKEPNDEEMDSTPPDFHKITVR